MQSLGTWHICDSIKKQFVSDAESLPPTPDQPELVEDFTGDFAEEDDEDDQNDEDYLPSQGQESGSSASILNPSSQQIEVRFKKLFKYIFLPLLSRKILPNY